MRNYILILIFIPALISCKSKRSSSEFVLKPLAETGFTMDSLSKGTPLRIIAWSGGLKDTRKMQYLHQFIVIDKNTNDTLRVLARMISVKSRGEENGIYTPVSTFDPDLGVLDAEYRPLPQQENLMDAVSFKIEEGSTTEEEILKAVSDTVTAQKFVIMNTEFPFSRNYKTVIGVLYFDTQPW